jgi:hypothetical protein
MTRLGTALTRPRMLATAALLAATFATAGAFAQEPPPAVPPPPPPVGGSLGYFGEHGQIVVSSDIELSLAHSSATMNGGSATTFVLAPSLDYFASTNVSVGGMLRFGYTSFEGGSSTDIALGARVGYNIVLTNVVTLWLRGGLVYAHGSTSLDGVAMDSSGNVLQLQVFAPLLWHPASHFFLGLGPAFSTDLVASSNGMDAPKVTSFGILSTIGGYWGGL